MATILEILKDLAPEFANEDQALLERFIDYATPSVSSKRFKPEVIYQQAVALYAAHLLTLRARGGKSGPVSSIREGDLSISYEALQGQDNTELYQTVYGAQFVQLRRQNIMSPRFVE
jgi:hypothetical protein